MENLVKHHPYYKKRKRIGLVINILIVVIALIVLIYKDLSYLYLLFGIVVLGSVAALSYMRFDEIFANKTKKIYFKKGVHKPFIGKSTFSYNEEFIVINDEQHKWTEFSIVDKDDLYVFMYMDDCEKALLFPKFPKDLPLEERNELNEIIQAKFNVNIRL